MGELWPGQLVLSFLSKLISRSFSEDKKKPRSETKGLKRENRETISPFATTFSEDQKKKKKKKLE